MSEFLVTIRVRRPEVMSDDDWAALTVQEAAVAGAYRAAGVIARIWRIPGTRDNIGIWVAQDATELHDRLSGLPLWPHAEVEVRPLARHYLES